jgi:radical SAM modification target selenobiotic family peptide
MGASDIKKLLAGVGLASLLSGAGLALTVGSAVGGSGCGAKSTGSGGSGCGGMKAVQNGVEIKEQVETGDTNAAKVIEDMTEEQKLAAEKKAAEEAAAVMK